jgi:predicted deacetylase
MPKRPISSTAKSAARASRCRKRSEQEEGYRLQATGFRKSKKKASDFRLQASGKARRRLQTSGKAAVATPVGFFLLLFLKSEA